jgi:hypothetical protein
MASNEAGPSGSKPNKANVGKASTASESNPPKAKRKSISISTKLDVKDIESGTYGGWSSDE